MKKITIFILLAFLLAFGAAPAYAQPPALPHAFYGNVTINGAPALDGTQISATVDSGTITPTQNPVATVGGSYGVNSLKLLVQGNINPGVTITFHVTNANGTAIGGTDIYIPGGGPTEKNLSVIILEPPPDQYDLTISSTAGGSVTTPGEGVFTRDAGTVVSLVASPSAGYHFVNWTGDVANPNSANTTVTMDSNKTVRANFGSDAPPPPDQYQLTISSTSGGSVTTPGQGSFTYNDGYIVSLVAKADTGYQFDKWTGDVAMVADVNDPTTKITMNGDYDIRANFEEIPPVQYELTISSSSGGLVTTPGEGDFPYDEGEEVNLVASPSAGYQFVNWTGDTGDIANVNAASTTITMNEDCEIVANFEAIPVVQYELIISSSSGGSVTVPGEGTFSYDEGDVVNLVATPNPGNQFVNWTGNVGTVANVNDPTTTITINADNSITANFEAIPPDEDEEETNWPLIGGAIGGGLLLLLVIFLVRRRS